VSCAEVGRGGKGDVVGCGYDAGIMDEGSIAGVKCDIET
jgi:hypothetical protein